MPTPRERLKAGERAVLLAARRGFGEIAGGRMNGTIDAIWRELHAEGALFYRYSGMQDQENAFLACTFWMVESMALAGRLDAAAELMDEAVGLASETGLYSEEMEPGTRAMRGNLPQALTHLSLINAADTIAGCCMAEGVSARSGSGQLTARSPDSPLCQDPPVQPSTRPVTIVTGGSRGIGAATVLVLAGAGHDVVFAYRSDADAAADVRTRAIDAGAQCVSVKADVTRETEVEGLFEAAGQIGTVTGLVNNAGLTAHMADLADTPVEAIRRVLDVNLLGAVLCARQAVRVMSIRRGGQGGAIVNVSSAAATLGSAHEYVHYAAAKAGVDALTVGLAKELAEDGIRVNAVSPGIVNTEIHAAAGDPGRPQRVVARIPMGRLGEPGEIAPAIAWLLGPDAGYVTGAVLRIAGGA
ncbi:MAG: SDR family oxidoreductase [Solirubrobacterales bacterium]|nr:SDR family oxidoreductase [Solirubrobacterales bacterium]